MEIINLTPHNITIRATDGDIIVPPSGTVARVFTRERDVSKTSPLDKKIPVVAREFGEAEGIPDPKEDTIYLVSAMVASATLRDDVFAPDTGPTAIRNENGQIEAVTRLVRAG